MKSTIQGSPRLHLGLPLFASVGFVALGLVAIVLAWVAGASPSMIWVGAILLAVAGVELTAGIYLQQADGDSMQFLMGGALTLMLALIPLVYLRQPQGFALMLGLYLVVVSVFRGLDVAIDHPRPWAFEAAYALIAFALAVFTLTRWRSMDANLVFAVVGLELMVRGIALEGSAWAARRAHPELSARTLRQAGARRRFV